MKGDTSAIILAAGKGERLRPYTDGYPKGMLLWDGQALIERQIQLYRTNSVRDISIVTGYHADKIRYPEISYFHNPDYGSTNMVESLFCARPALRGPVVIAYADVVFEERILRRVLAETADIGVTVDRAWQAYWIARYGNTNTDLESLKLDAAGRVIEIGRPVSSPDRIDGRYVGLIRLSPRGVAQLVSVYDRARVAFWGRPWQSAAVFQKAYLTDLLQALVDEGVEVRAIQIERGWLEFDTTEDYERMASLAREGLLAGIYAP